MANKLISTNLERVLERIKSPLPRYKREIYRALIVPNWPKCQSINPHNFTKERSQEKYLFKFKLRATIPFERYKKSRQKWLVKKSTFF